MMRKFRTNPDLSDHEQLFGILNFNRTPFAPPVTIILVHDKHKNRTIYDPHRLDGWYVGISLLYYRYFKCYMTSTNSYRTSDTVDFLPHHFDISKTSSVDAAEIAA